jgi:hypothetical protein
MGRLEEFSEKIGVDSKIVELVFIKYFGVGFEEYEKRFSPHNR